MKISSKHNILHIDFDQDSEGQREINKEKVEEVKGKGNDIRCRLKFSNEDKFGSNKIGPGIFNLEREDDYNIVATIPFQTPKIELREKHLDQQLEKENNIKCQIQIVGEVEHQRSDTHQNNEQKQQEQLQNKVFQEQQCKNQDYKQQNSPTNSTVIQSFSPSVNRNLLNFKFEQSQQEGSQNPQNQQQEQKQQNRHEKIKRLLDLRPCERQKVTFQQITTSHDHFQNMRVFTDKQIEIGKVLLLNIRRNQFGFNILWPQYQLSYTQTGSSMLFSKKMMGNSTSNYYTTLKSGVDQIDDPFFIAKLRSNSDQNVYQIFTKGANPKKQNVKAKKRSIEATIVFKPQIANLQPREFQAYTLAFDAKYEQLVGFKQNQQIGLDVLYEQAGNQSKIFCFRNRKPIYSQAIRGYILNFSGRIQKASVKNFILEDVIAHREVLMMGKLDDNYYRADVSWPLKPYVAFCICVANFDSRYTTD